MGFKGQYVSILLTTVYSICCANTINASPRIISHSASRHDSYLEPIIDGSASNGLLFHEDTPNNNAFQPSTFYAESQLINNNKTDKRSINSTLLSNHPTRPLKPKKQFQPTTLTSLEVNKTLNKSLDLTNSSQSVTAEEKLESPSNYKLPRSHGDGTFDYKPYEHYPHRFNAESYHPSPQSVQHHNIHHGHYASDVPGYAHDLTHGYTPNSLQADLKDEHYHYEEPYYPLKFPKPAKHVEAHVSLGIPTIKPGLRGSEDSFIGPAFSRALKFWLPSALILTGASVLFPKRIHVPTDEQPLNINYRPKRNANFDSNDLELIPSVILHEEHSDQSMSPVMNSPVYRISYARPGRFINNKIGQNMKNIIPEFVPIPNSREYMEENLKHADFGHIEPNHYFKEIGNNNAKQNPSSKDEIPLPIKQISNGKRILIVLRPKHQAGGSNSTASNGKNVNKNADEILSAATEQKEYTANIALRPESPAAAASEIAHSASIDQNTVLVKTALKTIQKQTHPKEYDLTSNGPVLGLLNSVMQYEYESEDCQKRALCELAIRGTNPKATRFETFMWSLATLVPDAFTYLYDLDDVFKAIRENKCSNFLCDKPNLNIQKK